MTPPYKTKSGLQIGSLYTPTPAPHHDGDALRLQQALLGNGGGMTATEEGIAIACVTLCAVLLTGAVVVGALW